MGYTNNYTSGRFCLEGETEADIKMGPFLSDADGKTPVSDLDLDDLFTAVRKSSNDGDFGGLQISGKTNPSHDGGGMYNIHLQGNDVPSSGFLLVAIHAAGCLPVFKQFEIKETS